MTRERPTRESSNDQLKSERVYRELRRRIREMELLPGARLRKDEIAVEAGTSRAPINEAIARLAAEGLIDVFPQSGSFVSLIRPQDVRESMLIRTGLEVEAVRRVTQHADDELLKQLDDNLDAQAAAVRQDDMVRLDDLDEAFHATIFRAIVTSSRDRSGELNRARRRQATAVGALAQVFLPGDFFSCASCHQMPPPSVSSQPVSTKSSVSLARFRSSGDRVSS